MKVTVFMSILSLFSANVFAYKNLKTNNFDLRNDQEVLSIKDYSGLTRVIYKSVGDEYFYESTEEKKTDRFKISNLEAEEYDKYFVSQFIDLKYSMKPFQGKKCSKTFTLSMRGETLDICVGEKDKLNKIKNIIIKINSLKK